MIIALRDSRFPFFVSLTVVCRVLPAMTSPFVGLINLELKPTKRSPKYSDREFAWLARRGGGNEKES